MPEVIERFTLKSFLPLSLYNTAHLNVNYQHPKNFSPYIQQKIGKNLAAMDYFTRNILHALAKQMLNSITKKVFFRAELYECTSTIKHVS